MKPIPLPNHDCIRIRRELGWYHSRSGTLKVGIPKSVADALGVTAEDAVFLSVWEREDGCRVLVLEPDVKGVVEVPTSKTSIETPSKEAEP